jgi:Leucine-rich repeat (LRR) protein
VNDRTYKIGKIFFFFSELTLMTFLDLSNNKITEIYVQNFAKSSALQTLNLSENRIKTIAPNAFSKLLALMTLDLSNNKLEAFKSEFFGADLFKENKLRRLNLSNNLLTTLSLNLFKVLVGLSTLEVNNVSLILRFMTIN